MVKVNDKLFVYGSLLHNFNSVIGQFLKSNAHFLGEVYVKGVIFDLGQYPGLVVNPNGDKLVYGHLLQLSAPEQVFVTLDNYEGIQPERPGHSEYRRALIELESNAMQIDQAWSYVYNLPTTGLKEIPSGNYVTFIKKSPVHQRFIDSV